MKESKEVSKWGKRMLSALIVAALAATASACGGSRAPGESAPVERPPAGSAPPPEAGAQSPAEPAAGVLTQINETQAPAELQAWARDQQMNESPAYKVVVKDGASYIGVAGGLKRSGGYKIEQRRAFAADIGGKQGLHIDIVVTPPPPGAITTAALTNPMAFFKWTATAPVSVTFAGAAGAQGPAPETVALSWAGGEQANLVARGATPVSGVRLEVVDGQTQVVRRNLAVSGGEYVVGLGPGPFPAGAEFVVTDVATGTVLHRLPVPGERLADGPAWSENFAKTSARMLDSRTVLVEGAARAFEAQFRVDIRQNGAVVASRNIQADEGAPAFGPFRAEVTAPADLPRDGVEAWFVLVSPKDGSDQVDLVVPVQWGK